MGKLRVGPVISVVKSSAGTTAKDMDFYATTYSSVYGDDEFKPKDNKRKGTGYLANFKTGIAYSGGLDLLDNVQFGKMIEDNYDSSYTKSHRQCCTGSDGTDSLPLIVLPRKSGFTRQKPINFPDSKKVLKSRKETQTNSVHKPLLKRLKNKNVAHLDDGSLFLATETNTCYLGRPSVRMNTHLKDIGNDEPSGFTHYHHFDPILYRAREPFNESLAIRNRMRPTGLSEHQAHFLHWPTLKGDEMNSGIRNRAQRDTGYSYETAKPRYCKRHTADAFTKLYQVPAPVAKRVVKQDPCEYVNLTDSTGHKTLAQQWLQGQQRPSKDLETRLERVTTGENELSGYSTNIGSYVHTPDDRSFTTNYDVKFGHKTNYFKGEAEVNGYKPTNGFTKSTIVHQFGDGKNFRPISYHRSLHPLVAKVVKVEHPCYTDNTRTFKLRQSK